jgi:ABC-type uncharacterized transport system permease subunit
MTKFSNEYALSQGPNGNWSVADTTEPGRFISIDAFLFGRWNPWSAADKQALRAACAEKGIDTSRPVFGIRLATR